MELYICRFPPIRGSACWLVDEVQEGSIGKLRLKLYSCDSLETQDDGGGSKGGGHTENAAAQSNGLELHGAFQTQGPAAGVKGLRFGAVLPESLSRLV